MVNIGNCFEEKMCYVMEIGQKSEIIGAELRRWTYGTFPKLVS